MEALSRPEGAALMKEYMDSMSDPETRRVRIIMPLTVRLAAGINKPFSGFDLLREKGH